MPLNEHASGMKERSRDAEGTNEALQLFLKEEQLLFSKHMLASYALTLPARLYLFLNASVTTETTIVKAYTKVLGRCTHEKSFLTALRMSQGVTNELYGASLSSRPIHVQSSTPVS